MGSTYSRRQCTCVLRWWEVLAAAPLYVSWPIAMCCFGVSHRFLVRKEGHLPFIPAVVLVKHIHSTGFLRAHKSRSTGARDIMWKKFPKAEYHYRKHLPSNGDFDPLLNFTEHFRTSWMGCLCPAFRAAKTYRIANVGLYQGCFLPYVFLLACIYALPFGFLLVFIVTCPMRGKLRAKADINDGRGIHSEGKILDPVRDCLTTFLCAPFAICQEARTVQKAVRHFEKVGGRGCLKGDHSELLKLHSLYSMTRLVAADDDDEEDAQAEDEDAKAEDKDMEAARECDALQQDSDRFPGQKGRLVPGESDRADSLEDAGDVKLDSNIQQDSDRFPGQKGRLVPGESDRADSLEDAGDFELDPDMLSAAAAQHPARLIFNNNNCVASPEQYSLLTSALQTFPQRPKRPQDLLGSDLPPEQGLVPVPLGTSRDLCKDTCLQVQSWSCCGDPNKDLATVNVVTPPACDEEVLGRRKALGSALQQQVIAPRITRA